MANSGKHITLPEKNGSKDENRPFVCRFKGCGKSYIHRYKLNLHLKSAHHIDHLEEDSGGRRNSGMMDHDVDEGSDRDGGTRKKCKCPYEGCGQSYLHEYKLNLHLKKKHPSHNIIDENGMGGEHDGYHCPYEECGGKSYMQWYKLNLHMKKEHPDHEMMMEGKNSVSKNPKRSRPSSSRKIEAPPSKLPSLCTMKNQWGSGSGDAREMFEEGEDSEETEEEDRENMEDDGWMYQQANEDDEETEDED